jgi:hypothetical protein
VGTSLPSQQPPRIAPAPAEIIGKHKPLAELNDNLVRYATIGRELANCKPPTPRSKLSGSADPAATIGAVE